METSRPYPWTRRLACNLLPAVVLALSLGQVRDVEAMQVSSAPAFDAEEHGEHCDCGVRCKKASCCCGPKAAKPRPASPSPARPDAGPCLNSAPCGDPILPNAPPAGPSAKAAALALCGQLTPVVAERLLPSFTRCMFPPRRSSRLDDPPERPAVA
ncbi:hypothetical protein [Paludisphaera borealis]|uniref:hypothetical protein n=1 Tax=Paludisphaera borealis TaxID=1387353 RepID=UPI00285278F7|nr:hypothetical protein [Paludisphaera borealis]